MSDVTRLTPIVLAAAGVVLFVVAAAAGSNPLYGAADLLIGVALAIFALWPVPPDAPSPAALRGGLVLASAAAVVDGLLTVSDQVGTATNVLTWVIVAGLAIAVVGRGVFRR